MRVEIRGVIYESVPAAAEALGVSKWAVYQGLKTGNMDGVGIGSGKHDAHKGGYKPKPISFFGGKVSFRSMSEAARELGCSRGPIERALTGTAGPDAMDDMNLRVMRYIAKTNQSSRATAE